MNLVTWDPYRELNRINRLLGFVQPARERDEELSLGAWMPPVDIMEEKDRILLTAELPGFQEGDIAIEMEGNVLTLRGERKSEVEKEGRTFHRVERSYGQFLRSFTLPNNVDRERIQAKFSNGLLEIDMPKREEAKPRQIRITASEEKAHKKETIDVKAK
jgi:HSP20 family protein